MRLESLFLKESRFKNVFKMGPGSVFVILGTVYPMIASRR